MVECLFISFIFSVFTILSIFSSFQYFLCFYAFHILILSVGWQMWFSYQWYWRIDYFCDEVFTTHNELIFYDFISLKLIYICTFKWSLKVNAKCKMIFSRNGRCPKINFGTLTAFEIYRFQKPLWACLTMPI